MRTKKIIHLALFLLFTVAVSSKDIKEVREVTNFNSISVSAGVDVILEKSDQQKVLIVGEDKNMVDKITVEVRNEMLKISRKKGAFNWNFFGKKTKVFVFYTEINKLSTSSGADITNKGTLESSNLIIDASSGSDIELKIKTQSVSISVSSGADVELYGKTEKLNANSSSGSDIETYKLKAKYVTASASSGSDIELYASETLNASASSGADIEYKGDPDLTTSSSSGGKIEKE